MLITDEYYFIELLQIPARRQEKEKSKPCAAIGALLSKTANPSGRSNASIPNKTVDRWSSRSKAPRSPGASDGMKSPEAHRPRARARSRSRSPEKFGFEEDDDPPDEGALARVLNL